MPLPPLPETNISPSILLFAVGALSVYTFFLTLIIFRLLRLLWGPRTDPHSLKWHGEDRRTIPFSPPPLPDCQEIPPYITHTERYWRNARGMLLYTCTWRPDPQTIPPKGIILHCVGFSDSNTFLPRQRSIRLAKKGYYIIGLDPEGHGRSDGLHAYVPSFATLVNDYWSFFKEALREGEVPVEWQGLPVFVLGESMGGNISIQLLLKDKTEGTNLISGAVMLAPMVKIHPKMKPPEFLVNLLKYIAPFFPTLPITPTKDVLAQAFRRPEILAMARTSPYGYRMKPRLGTALSLLEATDEVERRVAEVEHPFIILQGGADVVTCPSLAQAFFEEAGTAPDEKEFRLYDGLWHSLVGGEEEENIERVYRDLFGWLDRQIEKMKEGEEGGGRSRRRRWGRGKAPTSLWGGEGGGGW